MEGAALSDGGSAPQIKKFDVPGQLPDTRFRLFGKMEIHAHSSLLKIHSAFFRTFMDSPDKIPAQAGAVFAYEWVDDVDDDGSGWHVVADSNVCDSNDMYSLKHSTNTNWGESRKKVHTNYRKAFQSQQQKSLSACLIASIAYHLRSIPSN